MYKAGCAAKRRACARPQRIDSRLPRGNIQLCFLLTVWSSSWFVAPSPPHAAARSTHDQSPRDVIDHQPP
eukprot:4938982-Prymnesium_polylepis.1